MLIVAHDLEACKLAFQNRQADARDRLDKLRTALAREAQAMMDLADLQQRRAEQAPDWIFTGPDQWVSPFEDALNDARRTIERADLLLAQLAEVDQLKARYGRRTLPTDDVGPTTELLMQIRKGRKSDPVLRLYALDHLTMDEVLSAREIGTIVYRVSGGCAMKTTPYHIKREGESDEMRKRSAADAAEWYALLHTFVYLPWADRVRRSLPLILGLVVDGESLETLRRRHRMSWAKTLRRVKTALQAYGTVRLRYEQGGPDATQRKMPPGVRPKSEVVRRRVPVESRLRG